MDIEKTTLAGKKTFIFSLFTIMQVRIRGFFASQTFRNLPYLTIPRQFCMYLQTNKKIITQSLTSGGVIFFESFSVNFRFKVPLNALLFAINPRSAS